MNHRYLFIMLLSALYCRADEIPTTESTINMKNRKTFTIALTSNPSTGYRWDVLAIPPFITLQKDSYVRSRRMMPGAPGKQQLQFAVADDANNTTGTIILGYQRPWEKEVVKKHLVVLRK